MRDVNHFRVGAGAGPLLLALALTAAHAEPDARPVHVGSMESCHKGLVVWSTFPQSKCAWVGIPQVKIFDGAGRLRFIGSALDAIKWAASGQPGTPIPGKVVVRDAATEARITHVAAPTPGHGWVAYYGTPGCEPCVRHLAMFRSEVMPKLGAGTSLSVFELGE